MKKWKQTPRMNKRVAVIGPILPFRGGIAQHTTMLKRALDEKSDTLTISFSRQYPAWIFPGESDRDPAYEGHNEEKTEYLIDSLNPLTWRKAVKRVLTFNPDTVVIPWWTVFWAPCFGYMAWALKRKNIEVVFFCHNAVEHESAKWKMLLTKSVLKQASRFVVHTQEDKKNILNLLPESKIAVQPHPIYDHFPEAKGELPRRRALELLFYGFVRPYKGLDDLIDAMGQLKGKDIQLTIAGEFWKGQEECSSRITELGLDDQIELRPRYHTDQETAELFYRADVVVLPYRSATGSGVVPIAYHYNKPVIVTNVGGLPDVVEDGSTGWVVKTGKTSELADTIMGIKQKEFKIIFPAIESIKKKMSWKSLAEKCLERYG